MRKLITANIIRLFKTSYFRIAAVIMASIGVFEIIMVYCDFRFENGSPFFDGPLTSVVLIPVLAIAAVVSLFVGSEYSDGTMRNKIIAGHSRVSVCLSLLLTSNVGGWTLAAILAASYLVPGVVLMRGEEKIDVYLRFFLAAALLMAVFSTIFTFLTLIIGNRAIAAVVCLILALLLIFQGMVVKSMLEEPEYYDSEQVFISDSGELKNPDDPVPNSHYMPENSLKRNIFEFLDDFTPGCQALQLIEKIKGSAIKIFIYDILLIFVLYSGCILIFRRKDLK